MKRLRRLNRAQSACMFAALAGCAQRRDFILALGNIRRRMRIITSAGSTVQIKVNRPRFRLFLASGA